MNAVSKDASRRLRRTQHTHRDTNQIKILLSAYACDPSRGSEHAVGWNWAYELARAGHNVWVLTQSHNRPAIQAFLDRTPVEHLNFAYVDPPRFPAVFRPLGYRVVYLLWQRWALKLARALDSQVCEFDVVHHVSLGTLVGGSQLWRLNRPFVFGPVGGGQVAPGGFHRYLRGGFAAEQMRTFALCWLTRFLFLAKHTVSNADLVLYANPETGRLAQRLGAARTECMTTVGVPRSWAGGRPQEPEVTHQLRVVWLGRLLPRKGILLALEALREVNADVKLTCAIIGDGTQGRFLTRWIDELGVRDRVVWRGNAPWADVPKILECQDVLLFTSLRETDGFQLIEAMAQGCAVVTVDHQGAHTLVPSSAGIKVPVTTPTQTAAALARALERLATDPALLVTMRRAALQFAAEHTFERKAVQAVALYRSILGTSTEHSEPSSDACA